MTADNEISSPGPDVDALAAAVRVTSDIIGGIPQGSGGAPTPCPDYDVDALVAHLLGWATNFADKVNGHEPATEPGSVTAGDNPGMSYLMTGAKIVEGYRRGTHADALPLGVVLMETVTHGWDLARATGQETPYDDASAQIALDAGRGMLTPDYRGTDKSFGLEVPVPATAPTLDQLVGFMGRDPGWKP
jgi:uncharacterized protein (TIGR03083 family)